MDIITQNTIEMQMVFSSVKHDAPSLVSSGGETALRAPGFFPVPVVIGSDGTGIYFLVKELSEELEQFIQSGKTDTEALHLFSQENEQTMIDHWSSLGFKCKYSKQPMEYKYRKVTIVYLQVSNPETELSISLIPWVMIPDRPFPIFTYVYAVWHYNSSEQKSMDLTAGAVKKVFGLDSFHKSTVCRSIKAMGQLFENYWIDAPLEYTGPDISTNEMIASIPELLKKCPTVEALEAVCGLKVKSLPEPVNHSKAIARALSLIPPELSKVTKVKKDNSADKRVHPDNRRRSAGRRRKKPRSMKYSQDFVPPWQINKICEEFIIKCRDIVLGMAATYHSFMI